MSILDVVDFAACLDGVPQQTIDDVDKSIPGFSRLAADLKQAGPILSMMRPHVDALAPLIAQLWPIFQKAEPDLVSVEPAVEDAAAFAAKEKL
jgi:hypothetical protein